MATSLSRCTLPIVSDQCDSRPFLANAPKLARRRTGDNKGLHEVFWFGAGLCERTSTWSGVFFGSDDEKETARLSWGSCMDCTRPKHDTEFCIGELVPVDSFDLGARRVDSVGGSCLSRKSPLRVLGDSLIWTLQALDNASHDCREIACETPLTTADIYEAENERIFRLATAVFNSPSHEVAFDEGICF